MKKRGKTGQKTSKQNIPKEKLSKDDISKKILSKEAYRNLRYGFFLIIVIIISVIATSLILFQLEERGMLKDKDIIEYDMGNAEVSLIVVAPAEPSAESLTETESQTESPSQTGAETNGA